MKVNIVIDIQHQSHIWEKSATWVMDKNAVTQSNWKKWMMSFIFGIQINIKVFYKLILSCWVCVARYAQSTQNKKFAYLCNISRKEWRMKLIFCLKINTKVFYKLIVSLCVCAYSQLCLKYPKQQVYNIFAISQGKWEKCSWFFCLQINIKGFFKFILSF